MIRRLTDPDADLIAAHLLRLGEDDRRMRFCSALSETAMRRHVARIDWSRDILYGFVENGAIHGMVEFRIDPRPDAAAGEAAFSVELGWRRRGVATGLMELVLAVAVLREIDAVHMIMLCENLPMREIARRNGFRLTRDEAEICAVARLAGAEPTGFAARIVETCDRLGSCDLQGSGVLLWKPALPPLPLRPAHAAGDPALPLVAGTKT